MFRPSVHPKLAIASKNALTPRFRGEGPFHLGLGCVDDQREPGKFS